MEYLDENQVEVIDGDFLEEEENGKKRKGGFFSRHVNEFMISAAIHMLILFLISLITISNVKLVPSQVVMITLDEPLVEIEPPTMTELKQDEIVEQVDDQEVTDEIIMEEVTETLTVSDVPEPIEENAIMAGTTEISDAPPAVMGVGEGSPKGGGLPQGLKSRSKAGKKGAMSKHGGKGTDEAVDLALLWLSEHQEYDGSWDATKYEGSEKDKVSMTGIALLAFLGAGYTEDIGPFKNTLRKGLSWLNNTVAEKGDNPHFGRNYASAIALMALSEASLMGSKSITKTNANKLAQMFVNQYQGIAWRYDGGNDEDQSVSGWIALGLKSAKMAEVEALKSKRADQIFEQYKNYVTRVTSEGTGFGQYTMKDNNHAKEHMTWVGIFQRQFLGFPKNDPYLTAAAINSVDWTKSNKWVGGNKAGDVYGVYYGTLAAFQSQGEFWKTWNPKMKSTLLNSQRKGDPKLLGGSWDPTEGVTAAHGGRVITTAMMALSLEIYYRYLLMN